MNTQLSHNKNIIELLYVMIKTHYLGSGWENRGASETENDLWHDFATDIANNLRETPQQTAQWMATRHAETNPYAGDGPKNYPDARITLARKAHEIVHYHAKN